MIDRRRLLVLAAAAAAGGTGSARAQEMTFFRIGTGGTAGTYYPLAGVIATAISNPPGSRPCDDQGGSCGVAGLVAAAVASNGSVANINAINGGAMESGFSQSDVAYWAYTGTGTYEGKPKVESLRVIANLYPESFHLVARKGSGFKSVADLRGKRVSLDEPGSGTLVDARLVLGAFGMTDKDLKAEYLKPQDSADKLRDGGLDAFVSVAGYPQGAIVELAATGGIELVPVEGPGIDKLLALYAFFARDEIPGDAYKGTAGVKTISINAQWVTSTRQPDDLVYEITKALWNDNTRKLLDAGHAKGKTVQLKTALAGVGIPLHAGADRFYKEKGMVK